MSKIQVKVTLLTPEINYVDQYNAIFHPNQNEITYKEKDDTKTKFNLKSLKLRRENKELIMEYLFKQEQSTIGIVEIKSLQKRVELNLKTKKILQSKDKVEIIYQIEEEQYKYKLEVI